MQLRALAPANGRLCALRLEEGEEVVRELRRFADLNGIQVCRVIAIGGFSRARLGFWDEERQQTLFMNAIGRSEVVSLLGSIFPGSAGPQVELKVILGRRDGGTMAGGLLCGTVSPSLDLFLVEALPDAEVDAGLETSAVAS